MSVNLPAVIWGCVGHYCSRIISTSMAASLRSQLTLTVTASACTSRSGMPRRLTDRRRHAQLCRIADVACTHTYTLNGISAEMRPIDNSALSFLFRRTERIGACEPSGASDRRDTHTSNSSAQLADQFRRAVYG